MPIDQTIAVISDIHFEPVPGAGRPNSDIADILLHRAVARLNDIIRPDVTVVLGDLLNDAGTPGATSRRARLRAILDELESPVIVIPGNHDGDESAFYADFERPPAIVEVAGMRLLPFIDEDRPGYCASRRPADRDRFRLAREGFGGPIVALQHVPVFPDGAVDCPYNHLDAAEIIAAMNAADVTISLSGHYHAGFPPLRVGPTLMASVPALYCAPFSLSVVRLRDGCPEMESHALAVDPALQLCDYHVHSEFGYCAQDTSFARGADLAGRLGLAEIGFAEHSGQLYFLPDEYWNGECHRAGVDGIDPFISRMDDYLAAGTAVRGPGVKVGLELDFDFQGRAVLQPRDRQRADHLLGSVHRLAVLECEDPDPVEIVEAFLWMVDAIVAQGVDILAHPFRIIRREDIELNHAILDRVVTALHRTHTAAEINVHLGGPPLEFVTMCMDRGVKLALGGDAHHLLDIGNFAQHLAILEAAGAPADLNEVLFRLESCR
ncbi:MAG: metallophosphoesterase [Lentisphaerae bacterium]|nr:metallophosphoesterase [Lentisphaerota bacterium]